MIRATDLARAVHIEFGPVRFRYVVSCARAQKVCVYRFNRSVCHVTFAFDGKIKLNLI